MCFSVDRFAINCYNKIVEKIIFYPIYIRIDGPEVSTARLSVATIGFTKPARILPRQCFGLLQTESEGLLFCFEVFL